MASPVMETMLSPRFLEGRTLASNTSVEISMPDDDNEAMYYICSTLHMRHNNLPKSWKIPQLLEITAVADKYVLHETLKPHVFQWYRSISLVDIEHSQLVELLAIAVVFEERTMVASLGSKLLKEASQPIEAPEHLVVCPEGFFECLKAIHADIEQQIYASIAAVIEEAVSYVGQCKYDHCTVADYRVAKFMKALTTEGLGLGTRSKTQSLDIVCQKLADLEVPLGPKKCATGQTCYNSGYEDYARMLKHAAKDYQRRLGSLTWN